MAWTDIIKTNTFAEWRASHNDLGTSADTHISDDTKHRLINDSGTTTTVLFSASHIISLLLGKVNKTGNETIAGVKTFSSNVILKTATFGTETDNTGTTQTINWTVNQKQKTTITAATGVTFTAPSGPSNLTLKVINGGTGIITWPATVKWPGGTEPTWTTAGTDICSFYFDGTNYYGMAGVDFS